MSVSSNHDGFTIDGTTVPWSSVRTIATYKHDLFSYDEVCLAFELADDYWVEVPESQPGFTALSEEIKRRFSGIPSDWYSVVTMPPFATNYRVLWRRA